MEGWFAVGNGRTVCRGFDDNTGPRRTADYGDQRNWLLRTKSCDTTAIHVLVYWVLSIGGNVLSW